MMRRALLALTVGLFALTLGCDSGGGGGSGGSKGVVGVSVMNTTNPFFLVITDNLSAELEKAGYETIVYSAEEDAAKQANQVKDFIVRKVAAIVLNPKDSKAIGPAIVEANRAQIPVFTVDIACLDESAKVVAHIGSDNYGGGKLAGEAIIEALPDGGKIAILDHNMVESCIERVRGFREIVDNHNAAGKNTLEVVSVLPSGGSRDVGYRSTEDILQAHGDLAGIFAINDPSALGARAALEKAGKADQVKIIGFDGQPEGKKAIKEGKIYADPIQFPDRMGVQVARAILDYFAGKEVEPVQSIPTSLYRRADGEKDPDID